jgi:hypothetical protein
MKANSKMILSMEKVLNISKMAINFKENLLKGLKRTEFIKRQYPESKFK